LWLDETNWRPVILSARAVPVIAKLKLQLRIF
jgi:hypothetical protein